MLYQIKKPIKKQMIEQKEDIVRQIQLLDEFKRIKWNTWSQRDIQTFGKIRHRAEENLRIKKSEEWQKKNSEMYKKIIDEMK